MKRTLITLAGLLAATAALAQSNLALSGVATQSSTYRTGDSDAWRAIDGNTEGNYFLGSVSITGYEAQAWWQVALSGEAAVDQVVLWHRTDCCADRLSDYTVSLWNDGALVGSQFFAGTSPATQAFSFGGLVADTVRVQLSGSNYLELAELQVIGAAVPEPSTWLLMLGGATLLGLRRHHTHR